MIGPQLPPFTAESHMRRLAERPWGKFPGFNAEEARPRLLESAGTAQGPPEAAGPRPAACLKNMGQIRKVMNAPLYARVRCLIVGWVRRERESALRAQTLGLDDRTRIL